MGVSNHSRRYNQSVTMSGKRFSKHKSKVPRKTGDLMEKIDALVKEVEELKSRVSDLEYFRDHAKEILDIQAIHDS